MINILKSYKNLYINRQLASNYFNKGDFYKAEVKVEKVLRQIVDLEVLFRKIQDVIEFDTTVNSKITFLGGEQNMGCIITSDKNKEYITKISLGSNREQNFYENIYPIFLKLYTEDAKFISPFIKQISLPNSNINAVVMHKIKSEKVTLKEKLQEIFTLNQKYSSLKYKELSGKYPWNEFNQEFILFHPRKPKDPITALHSFSNIHKKEENERLFQQVYKHLKKLKYKESVKFYRRLEEILLINEVCNKIDPLQNYSVQHGDLYEHNIIQSGGHIYCIDWGCARIGPIATDIAGLLGRMKMPFKTIEKEYLNHPCSNHLTAIDKVVFTYMLIIIWLIVYDKNQLEAIANTELNHALGWLEANIKN